MPAKQEGLPVPNKRRARIFSQLQNAIQRAKSYL